ncbi:MAG: CPBP family intramembrane metalloprotease [Acidobacteria bacterium]|nr:CPBP family intramembrane metalloprotease [Acidobacteriota bacterium]
MKDTRTMPPAHQLRTLVFVLLLLACAGATYILRQDIPAEAGARLLAALLIEAALFLGAGSTAVRERLAALPPVKLAGTLAGITALTWLIAGTGEAWHGALATLVAAVLAFWYIAGPKTNAADVVLLAVYGAVALGKLSSLCYPAAWPKAPNGIIGEVAWLRTLLLTVLIFRAPVGVNFGFFPSKREWLIGAKWFLCFLPLVAFLPLRTLNPDPAKIALAVIGTFVGHFVFVALREEFLFRGMLLPRLQEWLGATAGLAATCVVFGLTHLPFGQFPNWKFAAIATVAGWFYAKAYMDGQGIRAAMVTHALTNVVARVFLSA